MPIRFIRSIALPMENPLLYTPSAFRGGWEAYYTEPVLGVYPELPRSVSAELYRFDDLSEGLYFDTVATTLYGEVNAEHALHQVLGAAFAPYTLSQITLTRMTYDATDHTLASITSDPEEADFIRAWWEKTGHLESLQRDVFVFEVPGAVTHSGMPVIAFLQDGNGTQFHLPIAHSSFYGDASVEASIAALEHVVGRFTDASDPTPEPGDFSALVNPANRFLFADNGDGDDVIHATGARVILYGSEGDDTLRGGQGQNALFGEDGDDTLQTGAGNDVLRGGTGNDILVSGAGNDNLYGGAGHDLLRGGINSDRLYGDGGRDTLRGAEGMDWLFGGTSADMLFGGVGSDMLFGQRGNDQLRGGSGDDWLMGGLGRDRLWGQHDDDRLNGGVGNDRVDGGPGDDVIVSGLGHDSVRGGTGTDRFIFRYMAGEDASTTVHDLSVDELQALMAEDAFAFERLDGGDPALAQGYADGLHGTMPWDPPLDPEPWMPDGPARPGVTYLTLEDFTQGFDGTRVTLRDGDYQITLLNLEVEALALLDYA